MLVLNFRKQDMENMKDGPTIKKNITGRVEVYGLNFLFKKDEQLAGKRLKCLRQSRFSGRC